MHIFKCWTKTDSQYISQKLNTKFNQSLPVNVVSGGGDKTCKKWVFIFCEASNSARETMDLFNNNLLI